MLFSRIFLSLSPRFNIIVKSLAPMLNHVLIRCRITCSCVPQLRLGHSMIKCFIQHDFFLILLSTIFLRTIISAQLETDDSRSKFIALSFIKIFLKRLTTTPHKWIASYLGQCKPPLSLVLMYEMLHSKKKLLQQRLDHAWQHCSMTSI